MKKLCTIALAIGLCFSLSGCGGSSEEGINDKISDAGWDVDFDKDAGTVVANIDLKVNEDEEFSISITKDTSKVNTVIYTYEELDTEFVISYDAEDKFDFGGSMDDGEDIMCIGYILDEDTFIEGEPGAINQNCTSAIKKDLKAYRKVRDKLLDKHSLSVEDLVKWGNWYYKENK